MPPGQTVAGQVRHSVSPTVVESRGMLRAGFETTGVDDLIVQLPPEQFTIRSGDRLVSCAHAGTLHKKARRSARARLVMTYASSRS